MTQPNILILHATGTNRDHDAAWAVERAGGWAEIVHINQLRDDPAGLHRFQMLILPGGFSYGDALGAGRLWAADLRWLFQDEMARFIDAGKPVLGICNGFQALVKSGWLPGPPPLSPPRKRGGSSVACISPLRSGGDERGGATLTRNASNRFECRWVWLKANEDSPCVFTKGLTESIYCPVAHGEGRFIPANDDALVQLQAQGQIALTYVNADGSQAAYPANPNGSIADIAGVCNARGNVLGLMPHPEDHISTEQHPQRKQANRGLTLFENGIRYAKET
ncbi:MAG: phosphoribosylformylglycinamidine synthase I [Anaerolineae bacterium]|nr:phosphoribosylformylglycinamidine synthase I [Anaerolineae bacterium]